MGRNKFSTDHFIGGVHLRVETNQQEMETPEYVRAIRFAIRELQLHLHYVLHPKAASEALQAANWGARRSAQTTRRKLRLR